MKYVKAILISTALTLFSGCVAVPGPGYYVDEPGYYRPAPTYYYGPPVYYGPTVNFGFYGRYGRWHGHH